MSSYDPIDVVSDKAFATTMRDLLRSELDVQEVVCREDDGWHEVKFTYEPCSHVALRTRKQDGYRVLRVHLYCDQDEARYVSHAVMVKKPTPMGFVNRAILLAQLRSARVRHRIVSNICVEVRGHGSSAANYAFSSMLEVLDIMFVECHRH